MTHGRISFFVAILIATGAAAVHGQDLSRDQVAKALLDAEIARQSLRIEYEFKVPAGKRPSEDMRTIITRLTDGQGRYRQETLRPRTNERPKPIVQVDMWDGALTAQEFYFAGEAKTSRHNVVVSDQRVQIDEVDELGPSLGLRCWHMEQSVGTLLSDAATNAEVSQVSLDGRPVVEVKLLGPELVSNAVFVYRYDPQRDWLLLEWETFAYSLEEGKALGEGQLHFHSKVVASDLREVGDIWMPGRFDTYTTFRPGTDEVEKYQQTTYVRAIELNPAWTDADFTVDLASLPQHSQIVDMRWGGTYRLSEDVVLLGGRLHQLRQTIDAPIDPAHYTDVMLGSTPIVDLSLTASGGSGSARSLSDWLRLTGYLMIAAGAVGAAVLFFRHRFSGS